MKLLKNLYFYPEKGMMDCNTYVIKDKLSVLIDPGLNQFLPELLRDLQGDGIDPKTINIIMNTHLHGDHCCQTKTSKKPPAPKSCCIRYRSNWGMPPPPRHQSSSASPKPNSARTGWWMKTT
jgi:glyoxylase-like metal-dependent hydrolase (beta-lactamase superfamily II)